MIVAIDRVSVQLVDELYGYEYVYRLKDPTTGMSRAFIDRADIPNGNYNMPDDMFDFNNPRELDREVW